MTNYKFQNFAKANLRQHFMNGVMCFDPIHVTKHNLTYTKLSIICSKDHLYLLSPLSKTNFQIDHIVQEEVYCSKTNAQYK
jgi:hypothetical protein